MTILLNYHIGRVFLVRCVLVFWCGWVVVVSVLQAEACNMVVWSAGWDESHPNQQTRQPPIQSEKYQCRIDTLSSPDDGHTDAQNMYRS